MENEIPDFSEFAPVAPADDVPDFSEFASQPPEEREGQRPSIVGEFAKGVVSAPLQIFRGVGELGALAFDSTLDTDYVQEVSDAFDVAEEFVGRPETTGGEITRDLLAFGLGFAPIAGWLGRAGLVAKTGKGFGGPSKFMQSAEAFGLFRQMVARPFPTTLNFYRMH
jgi:hypothetical protein